MDKDVLLWLCGCPVPNKISEYTIAWKYMTLNTNALNSTSTQSLRKMIEKGIDSGMLLLGEGLWYVMLYILSLGAFSLLSVMIRWCMESL